MGTRGLVVIHCHGRYFIYWNQFDSYPEELGHAIVKQIPKDSDEFQAWLHSMRTTYRSLVEQYETDCLPVNPDNDENNLDYRFRTSFLAVDDRLEIPPAQTILSFNSAKRYTEWIYTIDLDCGLLAINGSVYFHLSKLPHDEHWIDFLSSNEKGQLFHGPNTPQEWLGSPSLAIEFRSSSKDRYKELNPELVHPNILTRPESHVRVLREHVLTAVFSLVNREHRDLLDQFILEWSHDCFCFREIAFAILSVAAGEVMFQYSAYLDKSHRREGYYLIPDSRLQEGHSGLLPVLLHENHLPGVDSGAAPQGNVYWLSNVLMYLVTRLDVIDVEEAYVAEAVDAGLNQGLSSFFAMVFSIVDVVMVQVHTGEDGSLHIQKSPLLNLFYYDAVSSKCPHGPRSRLPLIDMEKASDHTEKQPKRHADEKMTFAYMLRFFDLAENHRLAGSRSSFLPNEILGTIMEFTDFQTSNKMSHLSSYCRNLSRQRVQLSDDYTIVGIDNVGGPDRFILEDVHSGIRKSVKFEADDGPDGMGFLTPVIGLANPSRRSIIDSVRVSVSESTLTQEQSTLPRREFFWYSDRDIDGERLFNLPNHVYPGTIERAWGHYIKVLLREIPWEHQWSISIITVARWTCLLPPRYRELQTAQALYNGLHLYLRTPADESPQEWDKTMAYAVEQLNRVESSKDSSTVDILGRPVILAFGTRMRLFYYVHYLEESPSLEPASPEGREIAARCVERDPGRRLVQLIREDEPIDIKEPSHRKMLEGWIEVFTANERHFEWDPFTGKRRRYKKDEIFEDAAPDGAN